MARCGCESSGGAGVGVADSDSVDLTLLGGIITADVELDPVAGNLLTLTANGLRVDCDDIIECVGESEGVAVADSPGINFSLAGSTVSGDLVANFVQSAAVSFSHTLSGVGVYEDISEVPDITIAVDGVYEVTAEAAGNATITSAIAGTAVAASVSLALYKNNVLVPNSETRAILNSQGSPTTAEPALQLHGSGSVTRYVTCVAGDTFQLYGARVSDAGTTSQIVSGTTGRSRLSAHRIGA